MLPRILLALGLVHASCTAVVADDPLAPAPGGGPILPGTPPPQNPSAPAPGPSQPAPPVPSQPPTPAEAAPPILGLWTRKDGSRTEFAAEDLTTTVACPSLGKDTFTPPLTLPVRYAVDADGTRYFVRGAGSAEIKKDAGNRCRIDVPAGRVNYQVFSDGAGLEEWLPTSQPTGVPVWKRSVGQAGYEQGDTAFGEPLMGCQSSGGSGLLLVGTLFSLRVVGRRRRYEHP